MNPESIKRAMFESLSTVAPEADPASVPGAADLREELDIDSMDFLRYVTKLHQLTGAEIPEADYPRLYTLDGGAAYLAERLAAA